MPIDEATKYLKRQMADAFPPAVEEPLYGLSTGSLAADLVTGIGGFPVGRLSEVFGWEGSAKTTLGLQACVAAQARGKFWAYVDIERGVDLVYAERLGFTPNDPAKGLFLRPDTFEQTVIIIEKLAQSGDVALVIADSVPAMVPEAEFTSKIEDLGALAQRARLLSACLPRLTKSIAGNTALVLVNQMRKKVNTGFTPSYMQTKDNTEESSGGSALKFYSSLRLDMRLVKKGHETRADVDLFTGKEIKIPIANRHEVFAFKNKIGIPYRKAEFIIRYDDQRDLWGIDNTNTVINIAVSQGIIDTKSGGRFFYKDESGVNFTVHGEDALYAHLLATPEALAAVRMQVLALPAVALVLARQVP